MRTMEEIQSAVSKLSADELSRFREWFERFDAAPNDFHNCTVAELRKTEPRESLESVKKRLVSRGKLESNG